MTWKKEKPIDLLLLHAPSVYDFRNRSILYGPVSDVIPSSTVFEMYPLGFLTISSYLQSKGLSVRIVNLALRMMNNRRFDTPKFLARLQPKAVGVSLHWLPHAHGALEVARIVKEVHPDVPVIMGGLSSTYYHRELITYPQVDYVLRGDSTEPPLYQLLMALRDGEPMEKIPNLTWKSHGEPRVNPMTFVPDSLDYVDLRPDLMVQMVMRHSDLESVLPFNGWWENPITAVFTAKGCANECVTCGSSKTTCKSLTKRQGPVFRSPASLVANMQSISKMIRGPILLVGDLLQTGRQHAEEVLKCLREADLPNEIVFEFFTVPPMDFMHLIDKHVRHWSIEISPDSHDHAIRRAQDGEPLYSNEEMEAFLQGVLSLNCTRLDVFFMIGLPQQSYASVLETIGYCEHLLNTTDKRLSCFISPMGPFIDPGSRGFEDPERFGYKLFARTLEEHRQLLIQPTWESILNYETKWMTRRELVDATYDAAEKLNELKMRYGRLSRHRGNAVAKRVRAARALRARLDAAGENAADSADLKILKGDISRFSISTVCDKRELFWERRFVNFRLGEIARISSRYLRQMVSL